MRRIVHSGLILVLTLSVAACARSVTLNPDASQSYAVNVVNEMPHPMVISYDDGESTLPLGTVAGNRQERFIVAGARGPTVTVIATDEADTHTVRRTVTLTPGGTVEVRIN